MILLAVLGTVAIACGRGSEKAPPESPFVGQIVKVEGDRMEVEFGEGRTAEFRIADDSVTTEHLVEHMHQRWPVQVTFERRADSLSATRIDDAPTGG